MKKPYPSERTLMQSFKGLPRISNKNKWLTLLLLIFVSLGCKKVIEVAGTTGICPTVISTIPANNEVNVSLYKAISATFSEKMDPASINGTTFTLTQGANVIPGLVTYSGTTATFTPATSLTASTLYTGTITTGAKDSSGNALIANYVWTFTTGNPDVIPPKVISTDPANAAIGVALDKKISATFSESLDSTTINTASFKIANTTLGGTPVTGTVTYSGVTAVFTPSAPLAPGTTFTGTITTAVKDLAGNNMVTNYTWDFTTVLPDIIPPTVIATDPVSAAVNVPIDKKITAMFSEAMNPATITNLTFVLKQGGTQIAGTVTYSGVTATFSPAGNLAINTIYTATVTTGAKDLAGNPLVANYTWSFTTVSPDIIPPTVIATDPISAAVNVPIDKKITAMFSEAMNPATITNLTFVLNQGATPIAGTVTYSGVTATFSPAGNLAPNTIYTATVTTGAKDLAGNPLVANYTWSFTTVAPIVLPPILGTAASFGVFGGNAGITNQGINTVINNGSIGTTAASSLITGFHDGLTGDKYTETPLNIGNVTGGIFTAPPMPGTAASFAAATKGLQDANAAYLSISPASKPGGTDPGAGELGGLTLPPGVYKSASGTFNISTGNLTLDAQGDPNATWIFQNAAGLTVGIAGPLGARSVNLINGASAKNVYWWVGTAATINGAGGGVMVGTIISSAGITFSTAGNMTQTVLNGRAISLVASVTMVNTTINVPQ